MPFKYFLISATMFFFGVSTTPALADPLPNVSSLAIFSGSGIAGTKDGPPNVASFVSPAAIISDGGSGYYVSDVDAQNIRHVDRSGNVTTAAGSTVSANLVLHVAGGFFDGPKSQARFNHPSGLALLPNKDLLIADTFNHCIRILRGSLVSTFSGKCEEAGNDNGDRLSARYQYPRSLAVDRDGSVYVADTSNGIRVIRPDGTVALLKISLSEVFGISIADGKLLATGRNSLVISNLDGSVPRAFYNDDRDDGVKLGDPEVVGHPFAICAVAADRAYYTDIRSNTVRQYNYSFFRSIIGDVPEDSQMQPTATTRLPMSPEGIYCDQAGGGLVSNTGLHTIDRFRPVDTTVPRNFVGLGAPPAAAARSKIAYVGNSLVWYQTGLADSTSYLMQTLLSGKGADVRVDTFSFAGIGLDAMSDYIREHVVDDGYWTVVVNLNRGLIAGSFPLNGEPTSDKRSLWINVLSSKLSDLASALKSEHMNTVYVLQPLGTELSSAESSFVTETSGVSFFPITTLEADLLESCEVGKVSCINLWPGFRAYDASPHTEPLFATGNVHLTAAGRRLSAKLIIEKLSLR